MYNQIGSSQPDRLDRTMKPSAVGAELAALLTADVSVSHADVVLPAPEPAADVSPLLATLEALAAARLFSLCTPARPIPAEVAR